MSGALDHLERKYNFWLTPQAVPITTTRFIVSLLVKIGARLRIDDLAAEPSL